MTSSAVARAGDGARRDAERVDADLEDAIVAGDLSALDALYRRHASLAYGLALRLTGDESLAQNAVQAAFMGLWSDRPGPERGTDPVRLRLVQLVARASIESVRRLPLHSRGGSKPTTAAAEGQPLPMHPQSN